MDTVRITPSDVGVLHIRRRMEDADSLKTDVADLRAMIAQLERQLAMERSISAPWKRGSALALLP